MRRFLLSFVLIFCTINTLFAQRDTDHWIAPFYTSVTGYNNAVYLSTDSTTPFDVRIYNNNNLIQTVSVAKGAPVSYAIAANLINGTTTADAFTVGTKGLYLKGDNRFTVL
jgi:hypothetical protein